MKHSLIGLLALLFVMACTPTVPSQFIQPDEMEDLLYDYHVAQAMARLDHPGESGEVEKNRNFLAVLNKYGVTQAKFDSSLVYYYSHLDKLKKIYITSLVIYFLPTIEIIILVLLPQETRESLFHLENACIPRTITN